MRRFVRWMVPVVVLGVLVAAGVWWGMSRTSAALIGQGPEMVVYNVAPGETCLVEAKTADGGLIASGQVTNDAVSGIGALDITGTLVQQVPDLGFVLSQTVDVALEVECSS